MLKKGIYDKRFFLVFKADDDVVPGNTAFYHAFYTGNNLYGQFDKVTGEKCTITVSNMAGQVIFHKDFRGNGRYLLGSQYSGGIYLVTFQSGKDSISKKVFISNQ